MSLLRALLAFALCAGMVSPSTGSAATRYRSATTDSTGSVTITTVEGRIHVVPPSKGQVEVDDIAVAPSGGAVGWLAYYPNAATSYPIPLELVVYVEGKVRRFRGIELPIWQWQFRSGGHQVAFRQETVHGGMGVHFECRDLRNGRLVAEFTPEVDREGRPLPGEVPAWARELNAGR
jgi:hypothetical protein